MRVKKVVIHTKMKEKMSCETSNHVYSTFVMLYLKMCSFQSRLKFSSLHMIYNMRHVVLFSEMCEKKKINFNLISFY